MSNGLRPHRAKVGLGIFACVALIGGVGVAGAQGGDGTSTSAGTSAGNSSADSSSATTAAQRAARRKRVRRYRGKRIRTPNAARCDFLDLSVCLLPWPNNKYTRKAATPTGRRLNLNAKSMPRNIAGVPINPTEWNRTDGFSPGQAILVHIPGMDNQTAFNRSRIVPVTNIRAYANRRQPVVLIDARTKRRHPIFAELDARAPSNATRHLIIRPTVNLEEGRRYIVALRNLKNRRGKRIKPKPAFRVYRDRLKTRQKPIERRRKKMNGIFKVLRRAGIPRKNLYLAWDFTVASAQSLAGRALAMRNNAYAQLGDTNLDDGIVQGSSPAVSITNFDDFVPCSEGDPGLCELGEDDEMLRKVEGTLDDVPCYLSHPNPAASSECAPGAGFAFSGPSDLTPNFNPAFKVDVPFECIIPRSIQDGTDVDPARPLIHGHGLLGNHTQTSNSVNQLFALEHELVVCGVDWAGFASEDVGPVIGPALGELSILPKTFDRTQQGYVNFMMLGRAMLHEDGFNDQTAFQIDFGGGPQSVIDRDELFFEGISQGGVMGGALTALWPDVTRSALNVNGMNYSTLLERSVDFDEYAAIVWPNYPNYRERQLIISLLQNIWDRGDTNGYAHHMTTDPYGDTPQHQVLMHLAYGDHQVSNLTAEIEARTAGVRVVVPALDPGRHWESNPFFGLTPLSTFPVSGYTGSALVYYDGGPAGFFGNGGGVPPHDNTEGTNKAPTANLPNRSGEDPHSYPRRVIEARQQKSDFFDGAIFGPCGGLGGSPAPCYSNAFPGA